MSIETEKQKAEASVNGAAPELASNDDDLIALRHDVAGMAKEEATLFDVALLMDAEAFDAIEHGGAALLLPSEALMVRVDPTGAVDDALARHLIAQGKAVTWCSPTPEGRTVARLLHDGAGARLRHAPLTVDPREWNGSPELPDLLATAVEKKPPPIKASSAAKPPASAGASATVATQHDDYDVTSLRTAERLLSAHPSRLLVVNDNQDSLSDLYVLDDTGVWTHGDNLLRGWLGEIADGLKQRAVIVDRLDGKALSAVLLRLRRLSEPASLAPVREQAVAALRRLIARGELAADAVTICREDELNANMRYLGTMSGVVDLHAGRLLSPSAGRKALVTWQTPVAFDPAATHPAVDRLFAHLDPEAVGWWWRVLGFHLMGAPSRRFYVAVGPPSGGKTTLANAIAESLGPYASRPADDALESRPGGSAGLSPELEAFVSPRRWAIIDEAPRMKIAAPLLKRLSGDAPQTFRRLHEHLRTVPATATVLVICNPGSVPRLRLQDEAMADRLRELPYPAVPAAERDPQFKDIVETDDFRRAFLARMVAAAAAETPREPPDDVPVVRAATDERVREDVGELGSFACRIVRGAGALTVADLWAAWCEHNEELADAKEAGGIGKRRLSTALRDHVPGLSTPKQITVDGKKARGWRGWCLLTLAYEAEAPAKRIIAEAPSVYGLTLTVDDLTADERADFDLLVPKVRALFDWTLAQRPKAPNGLPLDSSGQPYEPADPEAVAAIEVRKRSMLRSRGIDPDGHPLGSSIESTSQLRSLITMMQAGDDNRRRG